MLISKIDGVGKFSLKKKFITSKEKVNSTGMIKCLKGKKSLLRRQSEIISCLWEIHSIEQLFCFSYSERNEDEQVNQNKIQ